MSREIIARIGRGQGLALDLLSVLKLNPVATTCTCRRRSMPSGLNPRQCSVSLSTKVGVGAAEKKKLKLVTEAPPAARSDMIGPPDPTSNIRPIKFYIPPNETPTERNFRLKRKEVLEWNQEFWSDHNAKFFKEKQLFVQESLKLKQPELGKKKKSLTPDELSVFYRKFLNENRKAHLAYNKEWYKKNVSLLWPALKVAFIRWKRRLSGNS